MDPRINQGVDFARIAKHYLYSNHQPQLTFQPVGGLPVGAAVRRYPVLPMTGEVNAGLLESSMRALAAARALQDNQ